MRRRARLYRGQYREQIAITNRQLSVREQPRNATSRPVAAAPETDIALPKARNDYRER